MNIRDKKALLYMFCATFGFAVQDTVVKVLAGTGSLWQLMLLRAFLVIFILFVWTKSFGRSSTLIPLGWFWPFLRGFFMSCAYTLFYASLPFISLSEAATCFFTAPIFVCIFSTIFLKETIGWRRFGAIAIGFVGVVLIIQPGTTAINLVLFFPLLAGISYALAATITRGFCKEQQSLSLTFSHNILYACIGFFMVMTLPTLPLSDQVRATNTFFFTGWAPLTKEILILIGATSITHIVAMTATIRAYQTAETSFVAPLEYFYLVFASLIDFFLWEIVLGPSVIIGIVLVVVSGVIIFRREDIKRNRDRVNE